MIQGRPIAPSSVRWLTDHIAAALPDRVHVSWSGLELTSEALSGIARGDRLQVFGRAAQQLGCGKTVSKKEATALLLSQRWQVPGEDRTIDLGGRGAKYGAHGLVITADKTISALLAHPDSRIRQAVRRAFQAALEQAIAECEPLATVRVGRNGVRTQRVQGLLAIGEIHTTNADGHPHLHAHLAIRATAPGQDGCWRTLDTKTFYGVFKRSLDAAFNAVFYAELRRRGITCGLRLTGSAFTPYVKGLEEAVERLSRAQERVLKKLQEIGGSNHWRDHRLAWVLTRRPGPDEVSKEVIEHAIDRALHDPLLAERILEVWRKEGQMDFEGLRLTPSGADTILAGRLAHLLATYAKRPTDELANHIAHIALSALEERTSRWTVPDLVALFRPFLRDMHQTLRVTAALLHAWKRLQLVATKAEPQAILRFLQDETTDTTRTRQALGIEARAISTRELEREAELFTLAGDLCRRTRQPIQGIDDRGLTDEQRQAARLIAQGRALCVVEGVAGAGKTFTLRPVVDAARRQGLRVLVLARNAAIARQLGVELGVPSSTLETAIRQGLRLRQPTLLIVDEAGLIDRHHATEVLKAIHRQPVQAVFVGDRLQNQPIDRRGTFAAIAQAARWHRARALLRTSYRTQAWQEEATLLRRTRTDRRAARQVASKAESEGRILSALPDQIVEAATAAYVVHLQRGETPVVVTATNSTSAAISTCIQRVVGIQPLPQTRLRWGQRCGVGDRVRIRCNLWDRGLFNGDTGIVEAVTSDGDLVVRIRDHHFRIARDWASQHVELAYAITADSAQGMTADRAIVVTPGMGATRLYTAATRGRQAPIYIVMQDALQQRDPEDLLIEHLTRDDLAQTAHEHVGQHITQRITQRVTQRTTPQQPPDRPDPARTTHKHTTQQPPSDPLHDACLRILRWLEERQLIDERLAALYRKALKERTVLVYTKLKLHVELAQQAKGRQAVLHALRVGDYDKTKRLLNRGDRGRDRGDDNGLEL